jgi:hypothetical protein
VLLRLGVLVAAAEAAAWFAERAATAAEGNLPEKADRRFEATALAAMSRVFARDAAHKVSCDGLRLVTGAGGPPTEAHLSLDAVRAAQAGLIPDMDHIADVLYGRVGAR